MQQPARPQPTPHTAGHRRRDPHGKGPHLSQPQTPGTRAHTHPTATDGENPDAKGPPLTNPERLAADDENPDGKGLLLNER